MGLFVWKDVYSVGIDEIDQQHQQLFDIANRFHFEYENRPKRDVLAGIFGELVVYTKKHFADEERMMRENNYPDFDAHKSNHDKLVKLVGWYMDQFEEGKDGIEENAMNFIKTWLNGHILGMDRKYTPYMTEH
jgi:hemerythrin